MARSGAVTDGLELVVPQEITVKAERRMSVVMVHSNEEEAAILLCISSTSPAGHSVNSLTNAFLPWDYQRSAVGSTLGECDIKFDFEQSAQTWGDEQCFERLMWSMKEISSDLLTACYDEQDNCGQLSENWFQQDARHYDEQQKTKRSPNEQTQLPEQQKKKRSANEQTQRSRLEDLEGPHEEYITEIFEANHRIPTLQLRGGRRVWRKMTPHRSQGRGQAIQAAPTCSCQALVLRRSDHISFLAETMPKGN